MSTMPRPAESSLCDATLEVVRIPWANGRRTAVRERVTLHCDGWASHIRHGTPHHCIETGEAWFQRLGDVQEAQAREGGGVYGRT
jgi:hypothetical protein